jgi:hypothetical protein
MIDHDLDSGQRERVFADYDTGIRGPIRVGLERQLEVTELAFSDEIPTVPTVEVILPTHESPVFHGPDRRSPRSVLPILR